MNNQYQANDAQAIRYSPRNCYCILCSESGGRCWASSAHILSRQLLCTPGVKIQNAVAFPVSIKLHSSLGPIRSNQQLHHQSPCANMAAATLLNPAMLLPATKLGNSPSAGVTYSLAVSSPFLKQDSMMPLSLLSTSSEVHEMRWEFCAISRPDTATPPAFAALPIEENWLSIDSILRGMRMSAKL